MNNKITVYVSSFDPGCMYCQMARDYFLSKHLMFTEIDVVEEEEARKALMKKLGTRPFMLPTIQIGNTILSGWDPVEVEKNLC